MAAAKEMSRRSSWFARVAEFMAANDAGIVPNGIGPCRRVAIGSFGQLAKYITQRTTASGQLTFGESESRYICSRRDVFQKPLRRDFPSQSQIPRPLHHCGTQRCELRAGPGVVIEESDLVGPR